MSTLHAQGESVLYKVQQKNVTRKSGAFDWSNFWIRIEHARQLEQLVLNRMAN